MGLAARSAVVAPPAEISGLRHSRRSNTQQAGSAPQRDVTSLLRNAEGARLLVPMAHAAVCENYVHEQGGL